MERTGGPAAFVPGEVLVKLKDRAAAEEAVSWGGAAQGSIRLKASPKLTEVFKRFGVTRAGKPFGPFKSASHHRVVKLMSPALKDDPERTKALAAELRNEPEVEYAELNLIMRTQAAPNDPYYASSGAWGQSFRDLWGLQKVSAEAAWGTTRGENVVVAVIDTGVDYNHEDIAANVSLNAGETGSDGAGRDRKTNGVDDDRNGFVDDWRGWDFVTLDGTPEDSDPMDDHGHGTHVAGTIAAVSGNNLGIAGVAPAARVMALKGLNENGSGTIEDLSKAIIYAADNGARVINASWGTSAGPPIRTLIDSIGYAHDVRGAVFVAAAGNSNSDVGDEERGVSPANIRDVVAVSAFDHTDTRAFFSNYGSKVDVAAPGGGDQDATGAVLHPGRSILSLMSSRAGPDMTGSGQLAVGAKYLRQMGTSMASPHVAGVAALIRARHPDYSPEQVRQVLRQGSDDVGPPGADPDSGHGRVNAAKALTVQYPLAVQLTEPTGTVVGQTEVSVRGTAAGTGFLNWRLEYGPGSNPPSWTQIAASVTPVTDGQLALWDLTQVPDGPYTLRLVAQNALGGSFEDRVRVRVDNIIITEPVYDFLALEPVTFFRPGDVISIRGTVAPHNFTSYRIDILDSADRALAGAKVTLTNDGLQKVRDGVLGTWDTAGVTTDSYTIRLTVNLPHATFREATHVIVDPSVHPGWPRNLGFSGNGVFAPALMNHLGAHDINGDGAKDLLVGYGNTVRVFDHTGAIIPGWPRRVDSIYPHAIVQQGPAVGDLDGDGSPDIVAANNNGEVFAWRADGRTFLAWPRQLGGGFNSLTVSDLNNDGADEIIAADWEGRVKVVNKDGTYLPGWPPFLAPDILLPVCVADLDGDRQKEVVVATLSKQTQLFALRSNGTIMPGWPQIINGWATPERSFWSYPAVGDLDGDRDLEIVIGGGDGKMHAFHHTGAAVSGWPQSTRAAAINSPAVGDLDGDGKAEVVAGAQRVENEYVNYLYAWRGDGTPLAGWPVRTNVLGSYFLVVSFGFGAPAIADVDGDGAPDIIASSDNSNFLGVRAYRADGSRVPGFPKPVFDVGGWAGNTVAVADLDNDGLLEMAWIDYKLNAYVWDLTSPADAPAPWPMHHHDARHTGAAPSAAGISIGGRVTLGTAGFGGVSVTLTSTSAGFTPLTVNTDAAGSYSFTDLPKGATYTVKPSKAGYAFTPASRSYSNLTASLTGVNFEAAVAVPKVNHALSANGATATASSTLDSTRLPVAAINGDRKGLHWGSDPATGSGWTDKTANSFPDRLEVTFPGPRTVDEVNVFGLQDNFQSPAEPTEEMTSTAYTLTSFAVEYWTGSAWAVVPGGTVTGNNKVWRKLSFPAVTTTKVRLTVSAALAGYSRVVEFEAWGPASSSPPPRVNVAASASGATATASSTLDANRHPSASINGDRKGLHWGSGPVTDGSGWTDATNNAFPDRLEIAFAGAKTITEVSVFGLQDNYASPVEPTEAMVSNTYALQDFDVEYWTGSAWAVVPGGAVVGNNKVWRKVTFPALMTSRIRVSVKRAQANYSRVVEVEAY